ncbi:hypothetical protein [Gilliamella apis]|uniref:Uncharacterized protein n=1 Tax=Gilliamella apis TaxID=1970738 RepID=A0A242NW04_9GAMM|nr:hypothetical protein [Gilliamella apis]OTQ49894.1 hypothetical protein B6D06_05230 [Gilliamella apis]
MIKQIDELIRQKVSLFPVKHKRNRWEANPITPLVIYATLIKYSMNLTKGNGGMTLAADRS